MTVSLGFTEPDKLEKTLATVMANIINDEDMEDDYGILKHEEGIDLMPGNIELSGLEVSLVNVMSREVVMRSYIEKVKDRYDYIEKEVADRPAKNIPLAEKTMGIEQNKSIRQYADAPAERTSLKAKLETMKAKIAGGETEKSMPQKTKGKEETYEIF